MKPLRFLSAVVSSMLVIASPRAPQATHAVAVEKMVFVPAGIFIAGVPKGQQGADAWPTQKVDIRAFLIDRTEVTNAEFATFVAVHPDWAPGAVGRDKATGTYLAELKNGLPHGRDIYPVVWVSWFAAKAFCAASNKRLPTAAEWEKAARGTDGRTYPWGEKLDGTRANFCDKACGSPYRDERYSDGFAGLSPVGAFPAGASPYGALDMSGNASEWVSDWLDRTNKYYLHLPANPTGPTTGESRVVRGGSYLHSDKFLTIRPAQYYGYAPTTTAESIGFRCAADVVH